MSKVNPATQERQDSFVFSVAIQFYWQTPALFILAKLRHQFAYNSLEKTPNNLYNKKNPLVTVPVASTGLPKNDDGAEFLRNDVNQVVSLATYKSHPVSSTSGH